MRKEKHLLLSYSGYLLEAGCDEAGRGCLAGPVFAAAVVLDKNFQCSELNDSKQLSARLRAELRGVIETNAMAWAVASIDNQTIDRLNILQATYLAMHEAIRKLSHIPQLLLIDGNRFQPFPEIPHQCIIKGDSRFMSIAAASVLAKTHRDEWMMKLNEEFPQYGWDQNKGYPTPRHISAIREYGTSPHHRQSFNVNSQLKFNFD